jgi:hypothetical protein
MGNNNSNLKHTYNETLINSNNLYEYSVLKSKINNDFRKDFIDMKDQQRKMLLEINHLKEKNQKLELELNKIQSNYGQEIFNLLEYCSVLQKDIENIMNNQRIISDFLQTNSRN